MDPNNTGDSKISGQNSEPRYGPCIPGIDYTSILRAYTLLVVRNPGKYPQGWQPISNDGVFYKTDAKEEFLNGDIPFDGTIVVGTNSYEGNVLYMGWNLVFTPDNITDYFALDQVLSQIIPVSGSQYQ